MDYGTKKGWSKIKFDANEQEAEFTNIEINLLRNRHDNSTWACLLHMSYNSGKTKNELSWLIITYISNGNLVSYVWRISHLPQFQILKRCIMSYIRYIMASKGIINVVNHYTYSQVLGWMITFFYILPEPPDLQGFSKVVSYSTLP